MTAPMTPPSDDQSRSAGNSAAPRKVNIQRRQELEHRLKSSPTDLDGYLELAGIYRAEEKPIDAKRILDQARKVFPDEEQVLWEYEEALLARSIQQLREVADLDQRLATSETGRELQRARADWAARRLEVCKGRLKRHPKMHQLRLVMVEASLDSEEYEKAIKDVDPLLDQDEYAAQAHLLRARCLLQLRQDAEAMVSLRAAALRRAVPPPMKIKVPALRLLCETAERLGLELTLDRYREHLSMAEEQLQSENQK